MAEGEYISPIEPFAKNRDIGYSELTEKAIETQDFVKSLNTNKVIETQNFLKTKTCEEIVQLIKQSIYFASGFEDLPDPNVFQLIEDKFIGDKDFSPTVGGNINFSPYNDLIDLEGKLQDKYFEYTGVTRYKDIFDNELPRFHRENGVEKKAMLLRRLQPGQFFAHGGYFKDFENVLKSGRLMSNQTAKIHGLNSTEGDRYSFVGSGKTSSDGLMLSFFSTEWLEEEDVGKRGYGDHTPGFYASKERGGTDIAYYCPTESLINNGKYLVTLSAGPSAEYAIANSPLVLNEDIKIPADTEDNTEIPFSEAYIAIQWHQKNKIMDLLKSYGYSDKWAQSHVYVIDTINPGKEEGMFNKNPLIVQRKEIMSWLKENYHSDLLPNTVTKLKKVKELPMRNMKGAAIWNAGFEQEHQ